ncbi:MFS transporter [Paraburkholderia bannensis]|uniref:MFS transporter n=1 Tax=Paraburkholderia bannensis TaxID=765414 RepID=UPI002AB03E2E|nr:MFS transporter [Paraburkholderia bannensis]
MIHSSGQGSGTLSSDAMQGHQADAAGSRSLFVRLSIMMLLEFIVFGSWFATLGLVLASNHLPTIIGTAYSLGAFAAIISPIFLGAIGDRYFASQKVLGVAHLLGGALMFTLPDVIRAGHGTLTLVLIFAYMLCFQPTLGLSNAITFRHMPKAFPYTRVFATLGWVIAGLVVGSMGLSASTGVFTVAGVVSLVLAVYSFTLPSTPPPARGSAFSIGDLFGVKSLVLFRNRNFAILIGCAFLTSISLGVYNSFASPYLSVLGIGNVAGVLAIGQASEVIFIASVPFVLDLIGMKWALLVGMAMWGVRFVMFVLAAKHLVWVAILGVALHGICNDFFLILSAIYIDRVAPARMKAQAQSWLIIAISGFGAAAGSLISGAIYGATVAQHPEAGAAGWAPVWLVPIIAAVMTATIWITCFRDTRNEAVTPVA